MTVGYVAHSYRVPPHVLYLALDLPHAPPNKRPLRDIAKLQHRSMDQIRAILQNAVVQAHDKVHLAGSIAPRADAGLAVGQFGATGGAMRRVGARGECDEAQ
jgi:hypothetical protein